MAPPKPTDLSKIILFLLYLLRASNPGFLSQILSCSFGEKLVQSCETKSRMKTWVQGYNDPPPATYLLRIEHLLVLVVEFKVVIL